MPCHPGPHCPAPSHVDRCRLEASSTELVQLLFCREHPRAHHLSSFQDWLPLGLWSWLRCLLQVLPCLSPTTFSLPVNLLVVFPALITDQHFIFGFDVFNLLKKMYCPPTTCQTCVDRSRLVEGNSGGKTHPTSGQCGPAGGLGVDMWPSSAQCDGGDDGEAPFALKVKNRKSAQQIIIAFSPGKFV